MREIVCYDSHAFLLHIDSYENGVPVGHYNNLGLEESGPFQSMSQLILRINHCLDMHNIRQSFQEIRQFSPVAYFQPGATSTLRTLPGAAANFSLQILYRRNASWQGCVTWLEKKETKPFRSTMELIFLINSAMEQTSDCYGNCM